MPADALIPGPTFPVRCVCCRHWITKGPVVQGLGEKCARDRGLLPPRKPRIPAPRATTPDDEPTLLDLLNAEEETNGHHRD